MAHCCEPRVCQDMSLTSSWRNGNGAADTVCRKLQHSNSSAASGIPGSENKTPHVSSKKCERIQTDVKTPVQSYLSVALHLHAFTSLLQGADILAKYTRTAVFCLFFNSCPLPERRSSSNNNWCAALARKPLLEI